MTLYSNVAPPKIPLRPKPQPWTCECRDWRTVTSMAEGTEVEFRPTLNPGYLVRCPRCKTHRPD